MSEAQSQDASGFAATPPPYAAKCLRCSAPSSHVIVMNFWPVSMQRFMRSTHNSVKLFPNVVACKSCAHSLSEVAQIFIDQALGQVRDHFENLKLSPPDLSDMLIDCVTKDEALAMWADDKSIEKKQKH